MRTYRFIRRTVIVAALALIPWFLVLPANAANQSPGAGMPSQETKQALTEGVATAQGTWVNELANSLKNYKATYPASNFDTYTEKLSKVRTALDSGNKEKVRAEMGVVLQMPRTRAYGINDVAADLLFNSSLMVAPIPEYRMSILPPVEFGIPSLGQQ
jgi:hypothetical protein